MDLSTSLNVLYDPQNISMEQCLERLARIGFRAFDWNLCDWVFDESPFVGDDWQRWTESVKRQLVASGVRFGQGHSPIYNQLEDSDRARRITELTLRSMEAAAILEVPWLVFHPGAVPGNCDVEHLALVRQRNLDWFGEMVTIAEKLGVGIAVENTADTFGRRRVYGAIPAELVELVDALGSPLVGICWDTGHAHMQGLKQGEALRAMGRRVKCLHVADNDGRGDQHVLPFYGTIDWSDVMAGLQAIEYEGTFNYETHNSFRALPFEVRDTALSHALSIGRYLVGL